MMGSYDQKMSLLTVKGHEITEKIADMTPKSGQAMIFSRGASQYS